MADGKGTVEVLAMSLFADVFRDRRVLVTGHTGFKGSWLVLWLQQLGARVTGVALDPESECAHWNLLQLPINDVRLDIRDLAGLQTVFRQSQPELVLHLAAQPLVRRSYREPVSTWATNVMGTVNVLECSRACDSVRAVLAVTTDKVYANHEWEWGYRETDRLGGADPYSASKAAAELVVECYRRSWPKLNGGALVATARAGNVVGGGDWSEDRLVPDLVRAVQSRRSLEIRSPLSTRPWQHVLESLSGYLLLGQRLLQGDETAAGAWNFGPGPNGNCTVQDVLTRLQRDWAEVRWHVTSAVQPHEAHLLHLDSTRAQRRLGWKPIWELDRTLLETAAWYRTWLQDGVVCSSQQLMEYCAAACRAGAVWGPQ
jgi:CDP-glucose 4,6-dehydratase